MGRDDTLTSRLPLPLARLSCRLIEATEPAGRWRRARDLVEAAARLLALVAIAEDDAPRGTSVVALDLEETFEAMRRLVPRHARRGDAGFSAAAAALLGPVAADELPRLAELSRALSRRGACVLDALEVVADPREGDAAPDVDEALVPALGEVLERVDFLAGRRLVMCDESGNVAADLHGGEPPAALRESAAGLRLAVIVSRSGAAPRDVGSFASFDAASGEFFFSRRSGDGESAEFYCPETGRIEARGGTGRTREEVEKEEETLEAPSEDEAARSRGERLEGGERRRLGEFVLESRIGQGAMGTVYRASQPSLGRTVAIKVMRRTGDPKTDRRFAREIRALGRVEHPNLVKIFTSGTDGDRWFYAMELVDGVDIQRITRRLAATRPAADIDEADWREAIARAAIEARDEETPVAPGIKAASASPARGGPASRSGGSTESRAAGTVHVQRAAEIVRQLAEAAHALHEAGLLHRDIKPSNAILSSDGSRATLTDLGLVRPLGGAAQDLTMPHQFVGTIRYASPEQLLGEENLGRTTDVYSLGVTLYELLTLRPLFGSPRSLPEPVLIHKILTADPLRPRRLNRAIPPDLESIVLRCIEKDPADRYATAGQLAADLAHWQALEPLEGPTESIFRAARKAVRRAGARHVVAARLVAAATACVVSLILTETSRWWSFLDRRFESVVQALIDRGPNGGWPDDLFVLTIDDASHAALADIANRLGVDSVDPGQPVSWRPLHGAVLELLVKKPPRLVASDIVFRSNLPELDARLASALNALRKRGTKVVLGVGHAGAGGVPDLDPALAAASDGWGWIYLPKSDLTGFVNGAALAVHHPPFGVTPSLSLAGYASLKGAAEDRVYSWDVNPQFLEIHVGEDTERVFFSDAIEDWQAGLNPGVPSSDRSVACASSIVPSRDVLARHTITYADLVGPDSESLLSRIEGGIVVLGDTRLESTGHPDRKKLDQGWGRGRIEFSVYMHAAVLRDLLLGIEPRRMGFVALVLHIAGAAALGLFATRTFGRRFPRRGWIAAVAAGIVVVLSASVAGGIVFHLIMSPTSLAIVVILTVAGSFWLEEFTASPFDGPIVTRRRGLPSTSR